MQVHIFTVLDLQISRMARPLAFPQIQENLEV
jgi:hypothetical protein